MDSQKYANRLLEISHRSMRDASGILGDFLDYLLDTFDVINLNKFGMDYVKVFEDARKRNMDFFELMTAWFCEVTESMDKGESLDFFGSMYEETWKGKGKASALGQFYTPMSICRCMAEMVADNTSGRYNDCACGSGRTLLAAYEKAEKSRFNWFDAGDIDSVSCKMCALNFMVHGMIGEVKQQNALLLTTPNVIYKINEVRYPYPTNSYSIRRIFPQETKENAEKRKNSLYAMVKERKKSEEIPQNRPLKSGKAEKEAVQLTFGF